jgi:PAS domain S-box-containing protein
LTDRDEARSAAVGRLRPYRLWPGLALIILPSLAFLALEAYHTVSVLPALERNQAAVTHTLQAIVTARTLSQAIEDAERGQRGFIITGRPEYLGPYRSGVTAAPERLAELQRLTSDNPEQQTRIRRLDEQIKIKLSELKKAVDARQNEGFDAARQIVETNVGFDSMRTITDLIGAVIAQENRSLAERQGRVAATQRDSARVAIAAGGLAVIVAIAGILVLAINLKRIASAQEGTSDIEDRFRILVNGVTDYAIYMLDPSGHIVSWNEGAQRIKGYTPEEIIGRHFSCFFTPEDVAAGLPEWELHEASEKGRFEGEAWRVRKDGSRFWASVVLTALRGPGDTLRGFAKVTRDLSERRRQQEALALSQAALAQAQKMEAIGYLTGGVAHDFNNLLTAIQGSIELIEQQSGPVEPATAARLLGPAKSAAERGAALTQRLLAFARRQALAPQHLDINRLVSGISELLRRTLGSAIQTEIVLAGGLWRSYVDANQLESALVNLAVNARDAMPDGGKLTIETGNTYLDDEYAASHEEVTPGQYVMLAVSDTGTGMTPETMAHALEPFFTTKEEGRGTGLGLSQVYGFVKQSGGHLKLYSEPGHGTTVKIYLPRSTAASVSERPAERPQPVATGDGESVLLVEDDRDVREFGTAALSHLGYRVLEAADPEAALRVLADHPEIALLFTDVGLPGLNGRQLADEARRRAPGLKILYTTGYARNAIVHHGLLDIGVHLLPKPFTVDALGRKLREALQTSAD